MPLGMTPRQILKFKAKFFINQALIEVQSGVDGHGRATWSQLTPNLVECMVYERGGFTFGSRQTSFAYDCEILLGALPELQTESRQLKVTVTQIKSDAESDDPSGAPETKRPRVFTVKDSELLKDLAGSDQFQLLRVSNVRKD